MPISNDMKVEKVEAKEYPPIPKDIYQVELLDVSSKDQVTYDTRFKPENEQKKEMVMSFQFTILKGKDGDEDLRCRNVWANFIPPILYIGKNGKNKLYQIIEAIEGAELTQEDEAGGITGERLNALIGKQCRISVEPKVKGDKTFDLITGWFKSTNAEKLLDNEEIEKCRVKTKDEKKVEDAEKQEEAITPESVPF